MPDAIIPADYEALLATLKRRIAEERVRVVLSANATMVALYWEIGSMILARQAAQGWGARVIDRLSLDLRRHGLTSRSCNRLLHKFPGVTT